MYFFSPRICIGSGIERLKFYATGTIGKRKTFWKANEMAGIQHSLKKLGAIEDIHTTLRVNPNEEQSDLSREATRIKITDRVVLANLG